MSNPTITIPLDPQTASAYNSAAREEKQKIQALLSLWLRELATGQHPPLQEVLDEVGRKAKARGLTPRIVAPRLRYERPRQCFAPARFKASPCS